MIQEVREQFGEAVEASGKDFATDPFFMALLLLQHKIIKQLKAELKSNEMDTLDCVATTLDWRIFSPQLGHLLFAIGGARPIGYHSRHRQIVVVRNASWRPSSSGLRPYPWLSHLTGR
jgi:hypothetical protein